MPPIASTVGAHVAIVRDQLNTSSIYETILHDSLVILKRTLPNYQKIENKCFL